MKPEDLSLLRTEIANGVSNQSSRQILLWDAIAEASRVHKTQPLKLSDGWYIAHPLHVVMILLESGFNPNRDSQLNVLIAGTQHDGPEDQPEETSLCRIEARYGPDVRTLVEAVTLDPKNPDKRASREKILGLDWGAQSLKMADISSNTIRTSHAIRTIGLAATGEGFSQSLADRVNMEEEFVKKCLDTENAGKVPECAEKLRLSTLHALYQLRLDILAPAIP
jgi:hypothetical protein